jgi:hypothetical protein
MQWFKQNLNLSHVLTFSNLILVLKPNLTLVEKKQEMKRETKFNIIFQFCKFLKISVLYFLWELYVVRVKVKII